jgi:hypothetical protein
MSKKDEQKGAEAQRHRGTEGAGGAAAGLAETAPATGPVPADMRSAHGPVPADMRSAHGPATRPHTPGPATPIARLRQVVAFPATSSDDEVIATAADLIESLRAREARSDSLRPPYEGS